MNIEQLKRFENSLVNTEDIYHEIAKNYVITMSRKMGNKSLGPIGHDGISIPKRQLNSLEAKGIVDFGGSQFRKKGRFIKGKNTDGHKYVKEAF